MAAVIEVFVTLDDEGAHLMRSLSDARLTNWNGIEVSQLRAAPVLRALRA